MMSMAELTIASRLLLVEHQNFTFNARPNHISQNLALLPLQEILEITT